MSKAIVDSVKAGSLIIWQQVDEGVAEPALAVENYSDCICISQDGNAIRVNYETVEQLCKILRKTQP